MSPLVSVIIPAHNNEQTLSRALDSIFNQTYKNLEIIVVDDASTDQTKKIAAEYAARDKRIQLISAPDDPERFDKKLNRNINAGWSARNAGLAVARGEYITFQDADDISFLNRIEVQLALLQKCGAVHLTTASLPLLPASNEDAKTKINIAEVKPRVGPKELYELSQKAKGIFAKLSPTLNRAVPFYSKRKHIINKLFFGSLDNWPGAGNSPLFAREVIDKVRFRPLHERVWPSFMGRGADRDFNFQVAETFKNSYYFDIPLYLWDQHRT